MLPGHLAHSYTFFDRFRRIVTGPIPTVARAVKTARAKHAKGPLLIFHDATGRILDIDTRGTKAEMMARLFAFMPPGKDADPIPSAHQRGAAESETAVEPSRGRGRPKLGVIAREVTLLPRHWEWLATQPGGASVALRKLVEVARKANAEKDRLRTAHERAYHFMHAIGGDLPGFEESTRALFANDEARFRATIAAWPADVRDHATWLAFGEPSPISTPSNLAPK